MRWEVFKQDVDGKPHQAVGSVHAAESRGALLNARHVFARRPAAVSLWVTPAEAIHSWTAEQLEALRADHETEGLGESGESVVGPDVLREPRTYLVFRKTSNRRSMTFVDHVGEVMAASQHEAIALARERYDDVPVLAWWLVPEGAVTASAPDDAAAWFEPAREKTYKQQSAYGQVKPGQAKPGRPRGAP